MSTLILSVTVPGSPVGKQRPRMSTRGGFARAYTAKKTRDWEAEAARLIFESGAMMALQEVPLSCTVRAVKERPKRLLRRKDPGGRMWRTSKPDADNVGKSALDALEKSGLIANDAQCSRVVYESWWAAKGEQPCVEIELWELSNKG